MRQREQVDQWWEVRGHDGRLIVTTWGDTGKASAWRSVHAAARRGEARTAHRVTRCLVAPLVEIAAWRVGRMFAACGDETAHASVHREAIGWSCTARAGDVGINGCRYRTKRAAMAAAEAHLAALGYRVKKEKR